VLLVAGLVGWEAWPALSTVGASFLTDTEWTPREGWWGLAPMIVGTILVAVGAISLAAPLGGFGPLRPLRRWLSRPTPLSRARRTSIAWPPRLWA